MQPHHKRWQVIAPGLLEQTWSEADVLGSAIWLWMHSAAHRDTPLHALSTLLLPAIKHHQFILVAEAGKPVFYLAWANFSAKAERRYLGQHPLLMPEADWNCGDRMWLLDWVAPFGHTPAMERLMRCQLLASRCAYFLYHRGNTRGLKVKRFRGKAVSPAEATVWFETHPTMSGGVSSPAISQEQ